MTADVCSVDGCERAVLVESRALCGMHYHRWQRHGDPTGGGPSREHDLARRMENYAVRDSGCWEWLGSTKGRTGYGQVRFNGSMALAHRVSYAFRVGPIPDGLHVLHRCDNRLCVNPAHLFLGTNADNVADMVAKGRQAKGMRKPNTRLTDADVRAIRRDRRPAKIVAAEYGIHYGYVYDIRNGWARTGVA